MFNWSQKTAKDKNVFIRRIIMTVVGVLGNGVCVAFFRMSIFGVDPFQALMSGLDELTPWISFGTLYVIVNLLLLSVALIFKRNLIGLGTLINLTLLGYAAEFTHVFLLSLLPEVNMVARILFLLIGIVLISLMAALYFTANLGVSTYDAVALILSEKKKKLSFKYWRIITDSTCVILGVSFFLLSGQEFGNLLHIVGIGTIITAFFMGPLIEFFSEKVAKPILR